MQASTLFLTDPRWPMLLSGLRHDIYHTPEYVALEADRTRARGEAFVVVDRDRILFVPYLVRSCRDLGSEEAASASEVISPYGYPGPLLSDAGAQTEGFTEAALRLLLEELKMKGICSAFIRLHPILSPTLSQIQLPNLSATRSSTVVVDLSRSEAKIWAQTRRGHQSTINKCIRLGLNARVVSPDEHVHNFIEIYRETMVDIKASADYCYDDNYFAGLFKLRDWLHLCVAEAGDEVAAACVLFECGGIVQAHLGGTRSAYRTQSPFSLLLHHARLWAKARGARFLHLGGGVGGMEDKLFSFKAGFSRDRWEFVCWRLVIDDRRYTELVDLRARQLNVPRERLIRSSFFPAYRAAA